MASNSLNDIEVAAKELQKQFLEEHSEDPDIDKRDIQRIKYNLHYVSRFIRHKLGDKEAAYEMMVDALKWRKSFGVQDLKYEELDHSLYDVGLAYHHGNDREQNTLAILNCRFHKKGTRQMSELQKYLVFALESYSRKYPNKKVTLIFDMSQCGLSNMDLDFIKFIINAFKFYFPNMLGYILVFEMPWLLQAAWKIIKSWLSEAAVRKIKFVTRSDITDFISPDQLLEHFGGEDNWIYDPQQYKAEVEREGQFIWSRDPLGQPEDDEEDEQQEQEEKERQVRFAVSQPPTRQSRFGSDEDMDFYGRSQDNQLLRGTAASPGYRRRQVRRLMNSQQSSERHQSLPSLSNSIDYGMLPSIEQSRKTIGYLQISPFDELLFCGDIEDELFCTLELTNLSDNTIAYKIKTTAPRRYKVRPNINIIDGKSKASVQVLLIAGNNKESIEQDKFLIQSHQFEHGASPPDSVDLVNFWKTINPSTIQEYRLKCRYSNEVITTREPVIPEHKDTDLKTLNKKLDQVIFNMSQLHSNMTYLKHLCIVLCGLLLLLLLLFLLF